MSASLIHVENAICRVSRNRILRVPRFGIGPGQHCCVFGGNGAGKSLLGMLVRGALVSGRSHVHYAEGFDPARDIRVISFAEQRRLLELDDRHDISEYSASAADSGTTVAALVLENRRPDERYRQLLVSLDIASLESRGIRFLSSGQLRRASIARALYQSPRLLILDEPLESIDHDSRRRIRETLSQWAGPGNASLLLCRRERDILPFMTHLAVMDQLTLLEQGGFDRVRRGRAFNEIARRSIGLPESLPAPPPGRRPEPFDADAPLIELRDVEASWGENTVFRGVTWTLDSDRHAWIRGPNGCGKSTLLNLISGQNHKAYGQHVRLFGRRRGSGESVWDIKARFGVVSNELHNAYIRGWRVLEVVVSGLYDSIGLYDDSGGSEREAALQWLEALSLRELAGDGYHELSFGQQRLVLLARAMIKHPLVLVLDEPCVGLDDHYRRLIPALVDRIAARTPTRVLYVSHAGAEEVPDCINQWLTFRPDGQGAWRVHVENG